MARASALLKALGGDAARLGVTELAERVGLAKGTVHGLLRTLEDEGLVEQDAETGKYRLGMTLFQLGSRVLENHPLRHRSVFWADALANRTRQSARVGVLLGDHVIVVHHVFRPDDTVQVLEVGASIPWHACALGKAIAAHLPAAVREELLDGEHEKLTGSTLTGRQALAPVLAAIAADGLAMDDQEAIVGEGGLAAPVFDVAGRVAGGLGITGPAERVTAQRSLHGAVRECARGLSRDLGARGASPPPRRS
ncbi:MAG TPA: IclR family transcriptional regulator [Mycobacteriales bacterium]